ncbi:MAG: HAMP domain-containing histidine kinase [Cyclobacteriaceae bacterium]|nr:HAMP domain-containing histidine kinase [Cyclobacteriaceae bacterium]
MMRIIKGIWTQLSHWGTHPNQPLQQRRTITLTNRISMLISAFTFLLCVLSTSAFGWIYTSQLAIGFTLLFLLPLVLNWLGFISVARVFLSVVVSLASIVVSIIDKTDYYQLEEFQYFEFRLTLLTATLFPFILFRLKEFRYWMIALLVNLLCIALYDPIHNWFGVGYYQQGFSAPNYFFLNYMTLAAFFVIAITTFFLKRSYEKSEAANQILIEELQFKTNELQQANTVIQQQRHQLSEENLNLNRELVIKNQQLVETNTELISHNNDLQQFSYTISHNLRGPLASITGLLALVNENELGPSNQPLLTHFRSSVNALDSTIRDLSNVIDTRNRITRLRQPILWADLMDTIKTQLAKDIEDNQVEILTDFDEAPEIFSVRPMAHSILYNLVSNAIKYRNPERRCVVRITTSKGADHILLAITDNGMGIDLKRFGDKLFSMYYRFHTHIEGKGLGLFLVKLQTEALGGKIEVKSEIDKGTSFLVRLKVTEGINEQLLLNNEVVKIYYDATIDALCTIWQKDHTVTQFEQALIHSLDFLKTYRTPNWISDVRKVPYRNETELNKTRARYRDEYMKVGMKRIAVVVNPEDYSLQDYSNKKQDITEAYPAEFNFFNSFENAYNWIKSEHAKSKLKPPDLPFQ